MDVCVHTQAPVAMCASLCVCTCMCLCVCLCVPAHWCVYVCCLRLCLYMCPCKCICVHACMYVCIGTPWCMSVCVCLCACVCVHVHLLMCICICVSVSVCMCVPAHISMCIYVSVCVSVTSWSCLHSCLCVHQCMYVCVFEYVYVCVRLCVWDCVCLWLHVCLCVCDYVCACVCVYDYVCASVCICEPVYVSMTVFKQRRNRKNSITHRMFLSQRLDKDFPQTGPRWIRKHFTFCRVRVLWSTAKELGRNNTGMSHSVRLIILSPVYKLLQISFNRVSYSTHSKRVTEMKWNASGGLHGCVDRACHSNDTVRKVAITYSVVCAARRCADAARLSRSRSGSVLS